MDSGCGFIEALSQYLRGVTEGDNEYLIIAGVSASIQTEHFPNTSPQSDHDSYFCWL
jgi:hypothetical protein